MGEYVDSDIYRVFYYDVKCKQFRLVFELGSISETE